MMQKITTFIKNLGSLLLLCLVLIFSGCATSYDVDIVKENSTTIQNHDKQQATTVSKKVEAIQGIYAKLSCTDNTAACGQVQGMSAAMASRDIAGITTQDYKGPVGKTGVDVQNNAVNKIDAGIIGLTIVANTQAKKGTNQTENINNNGDGSVNFDHSLNRTDQVGINTGSGSTTVGHNPNETPTENSNNAIPDTGNAVSDKVPLATTL